MRKVALLAAPLVFAAACTTYNPLKWAGIITEPPNPPTPLTPIKETVAPKMAWTAKVGKAQGFRLLPVIEEGRVYAIGADGEFTALDLENGHVATHVETKQRFSGGLGAGDGHLFAGTLKGDVLALGRDGKVAWTTSVAGEVIAPPSVSRKVAVVRTSDGRIFGLSTEDGKRRWVFQRPTPSLLLRTESGVVTVGGDVVAGYPNGKLIALDLEDGKLTWELTVSLPRGATELERIADIGGLPLLDNNTVCAAAFQGKLGCYDIQSRSVLWSRDISSARSLATDEKNVYAVDDAGAVHALDKKTGADVWVQDKLKYRKLTAPLVLGGRVVVGDGFGYLHVMSTDNGALIGRLATDGSAVLDLVPNKETFLMQTANGTVASVRF